MTYLRKIEIGIAYQHFGELSSRIAEARVNHCLWRMSLARQQRREAELEIRNARKPLGS